MKNKLEIGDVIHRLSDQGNLSDLMVAEVIDVGPMNVIDPVPLYTIKLGVIDEGGTPVDVFGDSVENKLFFTETDLWTLFDKTRWLRDKRSKKLKDILK
jgi:hypothetical protein